jgi:hypothetical protein
MNELVVYVNDLLKFSDKSHTLYTSLANFSHYRVVERIAMRYN